MTRSYGILTIMSTESTGGGPHMGAMMRLAWQWVWKEIFSGVVAAGYDDVNPAHVALFRYPGLDRQRPSELADQLQITRQSVNDLLGHLDQHGYLTREPDPNDGRARVVRLTQKGRQLQKTIHGHTASSGTTDRGHPRSPPLHATAASARRSHCPRRSPRSVVSPRLSSRSRASREAAYPTRTRAP